MSRRSILFLLYCKRLLIMTGYVGNVMKRGLTIAFWFVALPFVLAFQSVEDVAGGDSMKNQVILGVCGVLLAFVSGLELGRNSLSCKVDISSVNVAATRSYGALFDFRDKINHSEANLGLGVGQQGEAYHDQELTVNQQLVFWKAGNKEWYAQGWSSERKDFCNLTILAATVNGNISAKNLIANNC